MNNTSPRVTQALKAIEKIFSTLSDTNADLLLCKVMLARPEFLSVYCKKFGVTKNAARQSIRAYLHSLPNENR